MIFQGITNEINLLKWFSPDIASNNESKQINESAPPKIIRKNTYGFFDDLRGIEVNQFTWIQLILEVRFKEDP